MIIDLQKFIYREQPQWQLLERMLKDRRNKKSSFTQKELRQFNYLYERTAGDLVKISTYSGEEDLKTYLENLTAACYAEIHSRQTRRVVFNPFSWFFNTFPNTFRRNINAFLLACAITLAGCLFGGITVLVDNSAKEAIIPGQFQHVMQSPDERVKKEENGTMRHAVNADDQAAFASRLMVNNIKVSILALSLGIFFGVGTAIVLFYNGIILGAVAVDFIQYGHSAFLAGWLLPHGAFEIPAIIIAGQAGLVIGGCLLRPRDSRNRIFAEKRKDIVCLLGGVAVMLVWAGLVEAFFSQYHEPTLPYSFKITFGCFELLLLLLWLGLCGQSSNKEKVDV